MRPGHDSAMDDFKRAMPWLVLAVAAVLAGYWDIDLRLASGVLCGIAVMAGAGVSSKHGFEQ
jgi:hypothetical protein